MKTVDPTGLQHCTIKRTREVRRDYKSLMESGGEENQNGRSTKESKAACNAEEMFLGWFLSTWQAKLEGNGCGF